MSLEHHSKLFFLLSHCSISLVICSITKLIQLLDFNPFLLLNKLNFPLIIIPSGIKFLLNIFLILIVIIN